MRILILIYLLGIFSCKSKENCDTISLDVFTHPKIIDVAIDVYDKANGKVIFNLPSDEEAGWGVKIGGESDGYFKIYNIWRQSAKTLNYWENDWMKEYEYVWIEKGNLGLNTKNYDQQSVNLYNRPSSKAKILNTFDNVQTVIVHEVCNNWAYIQGEDKTGKMLKGWLSPKDQCSNPLTTCN